MINTLNLISQILKFNLNVPGNAFLFFSYLESFLSMKAQIIVDLLQTINKNLGDSINNTKDKQNDIIQNLGTFIIGGAVLILVMIATLVLGKL